MKKINNTFLDRGNISYEYNFDWNWDDATWTANSTVTNATWVSSGWGYSEEMLDLNWSSTYATASHSFSWNFTICWAIKFDAFNSNNEAQIYRITGAGSTNIWFSHNNIWGLNQFQLFTNDGTSWSSILLTTLSPIVWRWYYVCVSWDWLNRTLKVKDLETNINYSVSTTVAPSVTMSGTASMFRHPTAWRYLNWQCNWMTIYNNYANTDDEFEILVLKWRRQFWPTHLIDRSQGFPKYSLRNLEVGKILEISKPQSGWTYYDQTGNWNNWTNNGVTDASLGLNNVMTFDWGADYINISSAVNTWTSATFAFSIYKKDDADQAYFVEMDYANAWHCFFDNASKKINYRFWWTNMLSTPANPVVNNKWNRILITHTWTTWKIYINWIESVSWTVNAKTSSWTSLEIWRLWQLAIYYLNGDMNKFEVWNRALSDTEIQQDYYSNKII